MNEHSLEPVFTSSLTKWEYIFVIPYIVMHLLVLPILFGMLFPQADVSVINAAVYGFGMVYMLLVGLKFLRRDFDALCDNLPLILAVVAGSYIRMMVANYGANELIYRGFDLLEGESAAIDISFFAAVLLLASPLIAELVKAKTRDTEAAHNHAAAAIRTVWLVLQLLALYSCMASLAERVLEQLEVNPNTAGVADMAESSPGIVLGVAIFMAPIVEEMIFRAGVFGLVRKKSRAAAYALSIIAFSVYHITGYISMDAGNWLFILQYIPISFLLCRSYEKTNCIWTSIFLHMAVNTISMQILQLM